MIRAVFRLGEGEWEEIREEMLPEQRSANEIALKWRQIKWVMRRDLKRARA